MVAKLYSLPRQPHQLALYGGHESNMRNNNRSLLALCAALLLAIMTVTAKADGIIATPPAAEGIIATPPVAPCEPPQVTTQTTDESLLASIVDALAQVGFLL